MLYFGTWRYLRDRDPSAYRKLPHHSKKSRSEDYKTRQAWRIASGEAKDRRRRPSYPYGGSCRTFWVRRQQREHRAWVRKNLKTEDYDAFTQDGRWEGPGRANRWLWD